jgi:hypothetical protein
MINKCGCGSQHIQLAQRDMNDNKPDEMTATILLLNRFNRFWYFCDDCGMRDDYFFYTPEEALEHWNTAHPDITALTAERDKALRALEIIASNFEFYKYPNSYSHDDVIDMVAKALAKAEETKCE